MSGGAGYGNTPVQGPEAGQSGLQSCVRPWGQDCVTIITYLIGPGPRLCCTKYSSSHTGQTNVVLEVDCVPLNVENFLIFCLFNFNYFYRAISHNKTNIAF